MITEQEGPTYRNKDRCGHATQKTLCKPFHNFGKSRAEALSPFRWPGYAGRSIPTRQLKGSGQTAPDKDASRPCSANSTSQRLALPSRW